MAAYRVTAIYYRFTSETPHDRFEEAAAASGTLGSFTYTLSDGVLKAIPTVDFRDRQAARDALEPYLGDWEESAYLSDRALRIRFVYDRSSVEDVDPQPGVLNLFAELHGSGFAAATLTIAQRDNAAYPPFDAHFRRTELTERLVSRLRRARDGGETWPAFAYFVLTQLEADFNGRNGAAVGLSVSRKVLDKLGRICDRRDPEIGRKAGRNPESITAPERVWLEAVVVRLIRRVGEHARGGPLPQITMTDFPAIP